MSNQFIIRVYDMEWGMYMYYVAGLTLYAWSSSPSDAQAYTMYDSAVSRRDTLKRILWERNEYDRKYKDLEIIPVKIIVKLTEEEE